MRNDLDIDIDWNRVSTKLHHDMLETTRVEKPQTVGVAAVILKTVDGTEAVITHYVEHGDGEGVRYARDNVEEIKQEGLLLPGESIGYKMRELPFA